MLTNLILCDTIRYTEKTKEVIDMTVYVKDASKSVLSGLSKMKAAMIEDYAKFMPPEKSEITAKMNKDYAENFTIKYGKKYIKIVEKGGGVKAALQIMSDWYFQYDCLHWIVEENGFQTAIRQDEKIKEFVLRSGVTMQGHITGKNKHDPMYGVGSMAGLFENHKIHF